MTHPKDLLADYVDGSLEAAARASVDAHLAECPRCREEVGHAGAARAELRRLPQVEAPAGVASKALREAAGSKAQRPPRYARLLPIAAAAVLVGLLAIALPHLGRNDGSLQAATDGAPEASSGGLATDSSSTQDLARFAKHGPPLDEEQVDFTEDALRSLVNEAAIRWSGVAFPNDLSFANAVSETAAAPDATLSAGDARGAARCVFTDVPAVKPSILVRLISATYQGDPAFIAVVLEGTEAGKPPDRAVVWIVRKDDCSVARVTEARL